MTSVGRLFRAYTLGGDVRRDAEAALAASRNGGHVPVAVWLNPAVPEIQIDVPVVRHRHMSKMMIYVEETAAGPEEVLQPRLI